MRPNPEQRRLIRADLHRYVDEVMDLRPTVEDMARTPRPKTSEPRGGGSKPIVNRPTEREALTPNPARLWVQRLDKVFNELHKLANEARAAIGDPVDACPGCRQIPQPGETTHKANGRTYHHRCYIRQRRAEQRL